MLVTNYALIGAGGFGREVYSHMVDDGLMTHANIRFYVDAEYADNNNTFPIEAIDFINERILVCIGDPKLREEMVNKLPNHAKFARFIHSSAKILDTHGVYIGEGSIICAGCILTTNIVLGRHAHLNLNTTIGHDVRAGDYFTTAPAVNISGNLDAGDRVYFGTNSSTREKISICDDVTVGLNAGVVKNIKDPGIYVGSPAKLLK